MMLRGAAARPQLLPDYDAALAWAAVTLLALGLVMVYSASIATAEGTRAGGHNAQFYLWRHGAFLGVGLILALATLQVPLRWWQRAAPWLFLAGFGLLVLVLVPGLGREVNGSQRWLPLGVINLQPSELVKLFAVLYAADYTVRKAAYLNSLCRGFLPMLAVMLATGTLLLLEPDYGAFAVITVIAMAMLFLGGMNWRLFAGQMALLLAGFVLLIALAPYRLQRIAGFMDPWADPYGKGYQLSHALIAFGRGEWLGVGLGASVEKLFYLPEAHTDFLMAVIAEELGFAGVAAVIALFAWLVWRAFAIGRRAAMLERDFAALVAQGIGVWLGAQAFINMGVNMGMLPTKGLTLPLMSYGGSALAVNCAAIALLARVDHENRQITKGYAV
ncbi:MAG TPA: putative lipid II flippase FtsW [Burkholderiales bacterium]